MENVYSKLLRQLRAGHEACLCTWKLVGETSRKTVEEPAKTAGGTWTEYYYPEERLIILGGGHVSWPLALFGTECGFAVTVVDDRPAFANTQRFPRVRQVLCESFERCFDKLQLTGRDYVVVVTRGHRYDMDCLRRILSGRAPFYVGMMGSKRRTAGVRQMLEAEGWDRERIDRIHMPIGCAIGALTPSEIAVSVMAEIIGEKRHHPQEKWMAADADFRVLERLASEVRPHATVTILSTKGSVPRRAGAKMIVYEDGQIYGSIGGGCSEAEVMREALKYIGTGRCAVKYVDMTKDVSEEDVMVCGGVMEVLIEG